MKRKPETKKGNRRREKRLHTGVKGVIGAARMMA
jgi:hypothetical protein